MNTQIVKNVFSNYFIFFIQTVTGVLIVPFLIAKLGKSAFGLTVLAESTIAFFEFIAASVRISLSRHATFALSSGKHEEFLDYLSSGKYVLSICGAVVLVLGCALSYFFPNIFHVPADMEFQSKLMFFFIAIAIVITIPNIINWSILYAKQRYDLINTAFSGGVILRAGAIFLLYSILPKKYASLATYGLIYLLMRVAQNYLVYLWSRKIMPGIKISSKNINFVMVRELISFSGYTSLSSISSLLYDSTANILINIFYGPSLNAVYAVSLKFPSMLKLVFLQATWTLIPTVTDLAAKNETEKLERLFFTYSKLLAIATIPLSFFIMMFSDQIINVWVGKDFSTAGQLLKINMLPLIATIPFAVLTTTNNAYAKVKVPSQVSFAGAVLNVILGIVLAKVYHMGLYGFAISSAVCIFLVSAVFMPYYSCRTTSHSLKKYWFESFIGPFVLASVVVFPLSFLLKSFTHHLNLGMIVAEGLFIVCIYYSLSYLFLLHQYEKDTFTGYLNKALAKLGISIC
jgi:O-antigen/teichoic acid export membrane protein